MSEALPPYRYSPIAERKRLKWPGNARIAVWIMINIETYHYDMPTTEAILPFSTSFIPDVANYSWKDYGVRVGIWRILPLLDRYGMQATASLNADACQRCPAIVREFRRRGWEFLPHGMTNSQRLRGLSEKQERAVIRKTLDTIEKATGSRPSGWIGPGLVETENTLRILSEEKVKYVCDWVNDDQPYYYRLPKGKLVSVPYSLETNDIVSYVTMHSSPEEFCRLVEDQFDVLYEEGATTGKVFTLSLHPYLTGVPHRIRYLDKILAHIRKKKGVWLANGASIADWFVEHYPPE